MGASARPAREAGGAGGALTDGAAPSGAVRMRSVALYRSGVGFFAQGGEVEGDDTTSITVPMGQIDEVVYSLVAEDQGGTVRGVDYATPDRQGTGLACFEFDLSQDRPLAALLASLRGSQVSVQSDGNEITGAILGLELYTSRTPAGAEVPRAVADPAVRAPPRGSCRWMRSHACTSRMRIWRPRWPSPWPRSPRAAARTSPWPCAGMAAAAARSASPMPPKRRCGRRATA